MSDRSSSPQGKESLQKQKGKKTTADVKKPRDLPKAKKHKPMDSDEYDEVPHNTNLERLQTLSLQYQYDLSSQDRHPVPLRPVHKEHRPKPALRMNPLTTMTITEKENLAQQYKVHEVRDSRKTVLYPDLYVLTMMSIGQ